jgi:alkanesulfonate monooxygenase
MIKIFTTDLPLGQESPSMAVLARQGAAWEKSGAIDQVLIGYSAMWPHNFATASALLALTKRVGLIVAHRPGVMHPTAAARCFGTMDALSGERRLAINLVTGSSDKDVHREGDYSDKTERYLRAAEYVELMQQSWSEPRSFSHEGKYYKAEGVRQLIRPSQGHIPVYMGGDSDAGVDFGARYADVYMLWGEPLAGTKERIDRIVATTTRYDRSVSFSLSLRLFIGQTEEEAWALAHAAEEAIRTADSNRFLRSTKSDTSVGRERQLAFASTERHDDCFWTGLVKLLGGFANSAALVGTPDRVMQSLKAYRALGIDAFLITGGADGLWDPNLDGFCLRMKEEL